MNCPHCSEALSERGVFCKACAGQARCMSCREVLESGAAACVECGTRVGQPGGGVRESVAQDAPALSPNRNTLSYSEDRKSRKFEASLTDSAMHGLGDVFGELFAQRGVGRVVLPAAARTLVRDTIVETKNLPPAQLETEAPVVESKQGVQSPEKRIRRSRSSASKAKPLNLLTTALRQNPRQTSTSALPISSSTPKSFFLAERWPPKASLLSSSRKPKCTTRTAAFG
jgi:hypothetical protein